MENTIQIPLNRKYEILVKMISPIIGNLTPKEVEILVLLAKHNITVLDKDSRTSVRMELDMSKFNFNNYLAKLKNKKILITEGEVLKVNTVILKMLNQESFNVSFI